MEWIKVKKNQIILAIALALCVVAIGVVVAVSVNKDTPNEQESQNNTTSTTVESTTVSDETTSLEENSSQESTTKKDSTETTKKQTNNETSQTSSNSKINYSTGDFTLKINGTKVLMPQYSYIAMNSSKLYKNKTPAYSILSKYSAQSYFDKSVANYAVMNRAIELEKEFYWTNSMAKKYGISESSSGGYHNPNWSADEQMAAYYVSRHTDLNTQILKKMLADGTLKVTESEKNDFIRNRTVASSYISFRYFTDVPAEIVEAEKAYIRSMFGKNGVNSNSLSNSIYNDLQARADKIKSETGVTFSYSVAYEPAKMILPENSGIAASKYNVITETSEAREFTIKIFYDPVNHLALSDADIQGCEIEIAKDAYLKLKKRAIDGYSVTINKDAYINLVSKY